MRTLKFCYPKPLTEWDALFLTRCVHLEERWARRQSRRGLELYRRRYLFENQEPSYESESEAEQYIYDHDGEDSSDDEVY